MKEYFLNLKIKKKLLISFFIILIILLVIGIRQYKLFEALENEELQKTHNLELVSKISSLQYKLLTELHVLSELIYATNSKEINGLWKKHVENDEKTKIQFKNILNETREGSVEKYSAFKVKINNRVDESYNIYEKTILLYIHRLKDIKNNTLVVVSTDGEDKIVLQDSIITDSSKIAGYIPKIYMTNKKESTQLFQKQLKNHYLFIKKNIEDIIGRLDEAKNLGISVVRRLNVSSQNDINNSNLTNWLLILFAIIIALLSSLTISKIISEPINIVSNLVKNLAKGELPDNTKTSHKDEIGIMIKYLNKLVEGLKRTADFSIEIGKGNFQSKYQPLSKNDVLGNSLLYMSQSLKVSKEDEIKRKIEDDQRNWTTVGLAKFAEILRHNTENIKELSNDILKNLIKYLNANQGGIFIYNDNDPENVRLQLIAAYAFNRKKFLKKEFKLGEGLVGSVAIEKYTVYMTDIPLDYIEIESGIGSSNPKSILIVPLKIDQEVLGVIELASFNEFKQFEISLVEQIAESIASTLSTARINTRTAELLEQSKQQTLEMQEKEEEMRQNIEEMQTAHEETTKSEETLRSNYNKIIDLQKKLSKKEKLQKIEIKKLQRENYNKIKVLKEEENVKTLILENSLNAIVITNNEGVIDFFNASAQKLWGYKKSEVLGRHISYLFSKEFSLKKESIIYNLYNNKKYKIPEYSIEVPILLTEMDLTYVDLLVLKLEFKREIKYTMFFNDLTDVKLALKERSRIMESIMTNEFEYTTRIEQLEDILIDNNIKVPSIEENHGDLIRWGREYEINLTIIDQQHKKWIDFINKLYRMFKSGETSNSLKEYIKELLEYTDYHFGFEEKYLSDFNCDKTEEHKKSHELFIDTIKRHQQEFSEGNLDSAYKLMIFLKSWVKRHIQIDDKGYVNCFKSNGLH